MGTYEYVSKSAIHEQRRYSSNNRLPRKAVCSVLGSVIPRARGNKHCSAALLACATTLQNNQAVALNGIKVSTAGDFAVGATTCTTMLPAKGKCTIGVKFKPIRVGTTTGHVSVS